MSKKEMLINVSQGEECRIALLEDGKLEELYMERASSTSHVGNIYKGRVTNVEPSIQAAFVDFGLGRNGFLHISDLMPTYFGRKGDDFQEAVGRKMARRDRPPIQRCLRRGDEIVVQIIKEGIGTKGPTLSTYLSIPGRILVMMPGMSKFGVSRKIEDEEERKRLRTILDSLKPLKDVGFIIRTAGIGKTKTDIQRDLTYLTRLWQTMDKRMKSGPGPTELYTEGDLVTRTVRDVFSTDIDRIVIDSKEVVKRVKEVIKLSNPRTKNKVDLYDETIPLFHKYGIEREIEQMYSRHVPLPSGGSLVIDSTEAIVAIDVNSGKFRDHADAETTAFRTDMEAADEIARQLKLRDLGGVIICDFIDLRYERHRRELEKRLHDNLRRDRAKTKVLRMSQFGIIEMTRQRMRPSLKRSVYFDCPHCKGSGLVKTPESMSLDAMRRLAIAIEDQRVVRVELTVCPEVAFFLLNRKRGQLSEMEQRAGKRLIVQQDVKLSLDEMRLELFDARDGLVYLDELGMIPYAGQDAAATDPRRRHGSQRGARQAPHRDRAPAGARGPRHAHGPGGRQLHPGALHGSEERDREDERFELDEDVITSRDARPERDDSGRAERDESELVSASDAQAPLAASQINDEEEALSDAPSQVVDVDDPHEPMGDGPRAIDERGRTDERASESGGRRRRRRRGRRGRGRGDRSEPAQPQEIVEAPVEDRDESDRANEPVEATEAASDSSAEVEVADGNGAAAEGTPGGRRRRRRRGGRRHRRRREKAELAAASGTDSENESAPDEANAVEGAVSAPEDPTDNGRADEHQPSSRSRRGAQPRRVPPHRTPPQKATPAERQDAAQPSPKPAPPVPVARTGSTDRHLMREDTTDTAHPEPARRPRSHGDLDAIPEDFD
jgi:ribonuclease E